MIILDRPFISEEMKAYLNSSQVPVLSNAMALEVNEGHRFNLMDSTTFIQKVQSGKRIYTVSENSLEWIYKNIKDNDLLQNIDLMKNKVAFREVLKQLYPAFFYCEVTLEELKTIDFSSLQPPFVLKPAVGFFSVGVYTISTQADWNYAINDIFANLEHWKTEYPASVVGNTTFILEEYIIGEEYAVDAYFDSEGQAVILNIMKHDFSSFSDVSDRLYYTSKKIIEQYIASFTDFLNQVNKKVCAKNFPLHIELRINNGRIMPIEFNPMRFAGWCCTDLTFFAYGYKTYDYYLRNQKPDWDSLLTEKEDKIYSLIVLDKPSQMTEKDIFDYEKLCGSFQHVLSLRKLEYRKYPIFGFLFTETNLQNCNELEKIRVSDLTEFLT